MGKDDDLLNKMMDNALADAAEGDVGDQHGFELGIENNHTGEEITLRITVERIK